MSQCKLWWTQFNLHVKETFLFSHSPDLKKPRRLLNCTHFSGNSSLLWPIIFCVIFKALSSSSGVSKSGICLQIMHFQEDSLIELQFLAFFLRNMLKSTRSKWSAVAGCSSKGCTWNDPGQLSLKVFMALTYMAGLVAFQRYTGLLNPSNTSYGKTSDPKFSSQDALYWLKHYHPVTHG